MLREAKPYWVNITGLFLLSLASTPLSLLVPLPLKIAVDSVLGTHPLPGFLQAILPDTATSSRAGLLGVAVSLMVAIALLTQVQVLAISVLRLHTGQQLLLAFRA